MVGAEEMDRIKYEMLRQEFPFLNKIKEFQEWGMNCHVRVQKADLELLRRTPETEKHDTSCFTAYKYEKVYFVSENGDIKMDAVNGSNCFISHVSGTPSRETEGETIGNALINYPVDVLEFVVLTHEEYDDSINQVIDEKNITIFKGNWKQLQSLYETELIEKAQKEIRDEYLESATEFGCNENGFWIRCLNGATYMVTEEEMVQRLSSREVVENLEVHLREIGTIDLVYYETYPNGNRSRRNAIYTFKDGYWFSDKQDAPVDWKPQEKLIGFMNQNYDFHQRRVLARRYLLQLAKDKRSVKA